MTHDTCLTLEMEQQLRWVCCVSCKFTCSIADKGQGSLPCDLPPHLTFIPASGGSVCGLVATIRVIGVNM